MRVFLLIVITICQSNTWAQSIKLPIRSNVYTDTFAIYWQVSQFESGDKEKISMQAQVSSMYGDNIFLKFDPTRDSIFRVPFYKEFNADGAFNVSIDFKLNNKQISFPRRQERVFKILPTSAKIEALIDLVNTNRSISNLLLLATAYEEEQCFANAFYVYKNIISINVKLGREHFNKFYNRNFHQLNVQSVER